MEPHVYYKNLPLHTIQRRLPTFPFDSHVEGQRFKLLTCKIRKLRRQSTQIRMKVSLTDGIEAPVSNRHIFIFGMGFVGQYLAEQLKNKGWRVSGTCTSEEKRKLLEEKGYDAFLFKAEDTLQELKLAGVRALYDATHIMNSIPPSIEARKDPVIFQLGQILRQAIVNGNICWLGYLSSTRLYGHWGGDWVDEDSPAKSEDKISLARLDAEKAWIILGKNMGVPTQVFRLGGIYGPGRSALDTIIKQKHQELSRSQKARRLNYYTSRIHVADICQAILASIEQPSAGKVYNVVDDDPAPRAEVFSYALSLLETKWPGHLSNPHEHF
ncbi:hypothetical protein SUGI_0365700 [Cryptomeria japonica]|uniref:uncharacterized protein LOC131048987 isoform X2 n=1 Tax=Cryptomeria japonica TaxID=3369 RepID=UPI002408A547|nr:uncharacterized protein LOC131048987 isoform X2 [Cryptomeria japonica]GLJ20145.1 hypothetical protein SUGI_0365700 [Cryptomeria japonica]